MLTETVPGMEPEAAKLVLAALGYSLTLPPLSGETRRKLLDRAIRDLILRVARTQPVILALTDVQWADEASKELLAALAPALANTAALLVTTYRPEQLQTHLKRAIDNGVTKEEISEVITHMAFYAVWPSAMSAAQLAYTVLVESPKPE